MAKLKITQVRSTIGRSYRQKRVIESLGLGKINKTVVHNDTATIRGMITKTQHLIVVEEIK